MSRTGGLERIPEVAIDHLFDGDADPVPPSFPAPAPPEPEPESTRSGEPEDA